MDENKKNGKRGVALICIVVFVCGLFGGIMGGFIGAYIGAGRLNIPLPAIVSKQNTDGKSTSFFGVATSNRDAITPYLEASIVVNEDDPEQGTVTIADTTYAGRISRRDAVVVLFDRDAGTLVFDGDGIAYVYDANRFETFEEPRLVRHIIFLGSITSVEREQDSGNRYIGEDYINLLDVTFAVNLNKIGYRAFGFLGNLRNVTFLGSCRTIEPQAFGHCSALTDVQLPTGVELQQGIAGGPFDNSPFQPTVKKSSK